MPTHRGFHLAKWYLDCISGDGDALIAYHASLRWMGIRFHFSSTTWSPRHGAIRTVETLRSVAEPRVVSEIVCWNCAALRLSGQWSGSQPGVCQTLLSTDRGTITWECVKPLSDVSIDFGGRSIRGLGYVERLEMTLPPWELPIEQLRWGRFLGPGQSMVWIDWEGPHPLRIVLLNGQPVNAVAVADDGPQIASESLELCDRRILRKGPVAGIISNIPGLSRLLPGNIGQMHEEKWVSRGQLRREDTICDGWAIHERVCWRKQG